MQAVAAAVKGLSEQERVLIALYYYDEMTLMEVEGSIQLFYPCIPPDKLLKNKKNQTIVNVIAYAEWIRLKTYHQG